MKGAPTWGVCMGVRMRQLIGWSVAGVLICAAGVVLTAGAGGAPRGTPWSRISGGTTPASAPGGQLGLARTADGTLHVIWNRAHFIGRHDWTDDDGRERMGG